MDVVICVDGNRLLPDMERKSSSEETIIDLVFCSAIPECPLVSGILWDGISDSWLGGDRANVDSDPDLHHPIPQSFQARVRFDGSLSALGFLRNCAEFLDLVAELKSKETREKKSEM